MKITIKREQSPNLFEAVPSVSNLREAKEFVLIFRLNSASDAKPSPEQMQERLNWLGSIAAQNKLADKGHLQKSTGTSRRSLKQRS